MQLKTIKYLLLLVSLIISLHASADVEVNATNFPDEVFRNWVLNNIADASDAILTDEEIAKVTKIDCTWKSWNNGYITSLQGIQFFTALKNLYCSDNHLTVLDVSKNTELTILVCSSNQLTSLNVGNNTVLTLLQCDHNQLTALDVSKCTAIQWFYCSSNKLTSLDVSNNMVLNSLHCDSNELTFLDISKNSKLRSLRCHSNNLTSLNVSNNTALSYLQCYANQLLHLDLSKNTSFESSNTEITPQSLSLTAIDTNSGIAIPMPNDFDITKVSNLKLDGTSVSGNITTVDGHKYLVFVQAGTTQSVIDGKSLTYTYDTGSSISKAAAMDVTVTLSYTATTPTGIEVNATNFPDEEFRNWVLLNIEGASDGILTNEEITKVTSINCRGSYDNPGSISNLKGIEFFTALTSLRCDYNQLTSLYVSGCTALTRLSCYSNQLTSLDVSGCMALKDLDCDSNQLTSLDVSKNTALTSLYCYSNLLTSLDVSKNTALTSLYCYSNQLTSLDVSKNTALTSLECSSNPLTSLDVSKNTALTYLSCHSNQLTSLNVSKNTALTYLSCHSNQLTSLDVSKNTALTQLECSSNPLTSLDVSKNTALTKLSCSSNQLTSLDVSTNTALTQLVCSSNPLTSLDVSKNTALTKLSCSSNQLTSLDVSNNTALFNLECSSNQLTSLDVSKNTALTYLYCSSNQLTSLDVSNNTSLKVLSCSSNQLTSLDVSTNTALNRLWCDSNQLTNLDLSINTSISDGSVSPQSLSLTAVDISSGAAIPIPTDFDFSKVSNLKLAGTSVNGSTATVDGQKYLVLSGTYLYPWTVSGTKLTYTYDTGNTLSTVLSMGVTVELTSSSSIPISVSIAEFCNTAKDDKFYKIGGIITKVVDATNGYIYLKDYSGEIYVKGIGNVGDFQRLGLKEGDIILLIGKHGEDQGSAQVVEAQIDSDDGLNPLFYPVTNISIADFRNLPDDKEAYYLISGTIEHVTEASLYGEDVTQYGKFNLTDDSGSIYVYGVRKGWGGPPGQFGKLNLTWGDKISIIAYKTTYKGLVEATGAFLSHEIADAFSTYILSIESSSGGSVAYNSTIIITNKTQSFTVNEGTSATITITPNTGYKLSKLTVNGTDVTSSVKDNKYIISSISGNTTVVATFEQITYTLSVQATGNGTVTYNSTATKNKTNTFTVNHGTSVTLSISPDSGYRLASLTVNGTNVTSSVSNNQYTISNITANTTVIATFELIPATTYSLSIQSGAGGSVSYDGTTITNKTQSFTVNEGTTATITITPNTGYKLSKLTVNGTNVTSSVKDNKYTISSISGNTTVVATFEQITYTLSVQASGNGTVTYNSTATKNKTNTFTVNHGTSATLSIFPDSGYRLASLKVNGTNVTSSVSNNQYTISNITANTTVIATFELIPATTYSLSIQSGAGGSVSYDGTTITNKTQSFTVNEGTSATIAITPNTGYKLSRLTVNGTNVTSSVRDNQYTINSISGNTTVVATFEQITYTLSVQATGNGTVTYNSTATKNKTNTFTVIHGSSATLSIAPDNGYRLASLTVNGTNVTSSISNNQYTINSITANTTIVATFEEVPPTVYSLSIQSGSGGSVTYNGTTITNSTRSFSVNEKTSVTISISANTGYKLSTLTVNGSNVTSSVSNNQYTIGSVTGNITIVATFAENLQSFSAEGINYQMTSAANKTLNVGTGSYSGHVIIPATVSHEGETWSVRGAESGAFNNAAITAITWNPEHAISSNAFGSQTNPNMLLYVQSASYAPSNVQNVIANGKAKKIVLTDAASGNDFNCPEAFTAEEISYSHKYSMTTGIGESRGWETIALPFNVKEFTHENSEVLVPFKVYSSSTNGKPFWLYQMTVSGWQEATGIEANKPYIISIPNNDAYDQDYNLSGTVTFSSKNVTVLRTKQEKVSYGDLTFVANFTTQSSSYDILALNVNNELSRYEGYRPEGSAFERELRTVHPFEAYMTTSANNAKRSVPIFEELPTAIQEIPMTGFYGERGLRIYTLAGNLVLFSESITLQEALKRLPRGVYIINGKKVGIK